MIECINLTKVYGTKEAVSGLSFKVEKGQVFGLLGPNGAGKTTTIRIILGLLEKSNGKVILEDKERIGYSPESPHFINYMTAYKIMRFYAKLQHIEKSQIDGEITKCLECVGLSKERDKKVGTFSKGMLQRLAVAQALLGTPSILILDEPCAGLDAIGRLEMINLVLKLKEKGHTIILNSHILGEVEKMVDRVLIIKEGRKLMEIDMTKINDEHPGQSLEQVFTRALGVDFHD